MASLLDIASSGIQAYRKALSVTVGTPIDAPAASTMTSQASNATASRQCTGHAGGLVMAAYGAGRICRS